MGLKDLRDLCSSRGVAYIAEHGNACIRFEDGKVRLNPNSLRSRADLERTLSDYNLSTDGTVLTLRKLLSQNLMQLVSVSVSVSLFSIEKYMKRSKTKLTI